MLCLLYNLLCICKHFLKLKLKLLCPRQFSVVRLLCIHFAVSPMDYVTLAEVLILGACQAQHCVAVTIVDNMINEPEENFHVSLERTPGLNSRITLEPMEAVIAIIDNDGRTTDIIIPAIYKVGSIIYVHSNIFSVNSLVLVT